MQSPEGESIVFAVSLNDRRFTFKEKVALFDAMRSIVVASGDDTDMEQHLAHLSDYYTKPMTRRQWRGPPKRVIANHVILVWDECTNNMAPIDMVRDTTVLARLSCFMFYKEDRHAVHILNWRCRLTETITDADYYIPHLIESVAFIKRIYLMRFESGVTHLVLDVAPIAETLCTFGILMGFMVVLPESLCQCAEFAEACRTKNFEAFRAIASDGERYYTRNEEGDNVLRLMYAAKVCDCAIHEAARLNMKSVHVFHCKICRDVRFCTKKCVSWQKCCC